MNKNPHFFRMNCFSSGTLGFTIVPNEATANYDWQLFDITSTNPADIFTNPALFVACNWSSEPGETGASSDGADLMICGGPGGALFSKMPDIVAGRAYMLMVCNQGSSPQGYQLTFAGGSASITDLVEPHLFRASAGCIGSTVSVRLNKRILCNSIATDGSDFSISAGAGILSATPASCTSLFGTDSLILTLSQPLPYGNYTLTMELGTDGNTLMDICQRLVPVGESIPLISAPVQPTAMDSIVKTGCAPSFVELIFRKPISCSSIAADGSDFIITGPQPVSYTAVANACTAGPSTQIIRINFTGRLATSGTYRVELTTGTDGNSLLDICGMATPVGSVVTFQLDDPVSSQFNFNAPQSCAESTVSFFHDGNGNASSWSWNFGDGTSSADQNPLKVYTAPGQYTIRLMVSNTRCTDSSSQQLTVGGFLKADFDAPAMTCPGDTIRFVNKSTGGWDNWRWDFGNAQSSNQKDPPLIRYTDIRRETYYSVRLIASSSNPDCRDTVTHVIRALSHCLIAVPSAFTPNGDGKNDYLYPLNALKADQLLFRVYNRTGQLVFQTRDWTQKWDGRVNGVLQGAGIYAWLLSFTHRDSKEKVFMKGTTLLLQ
ncbi:MAG: PKD domain-containing protein [Bacteroidota bacterium]